MIIDEYKNCKEIYVIGPGSSKHQFDPNILNNKVSFYFSDDLMWFNNNNIHPTYWSFLDPFTTTYIENNLKNKKYNINWFNQLKEKSNIIFNDFQGTNIFYELGFSTKYNIKWNSEIFGVQILPRICSYFKNTIKVKSIILYNNFDSFYDNSKNQSDVCPIIRHGPRINNDKFSCFVLPLLISYFPELKSIYSIGFGDFTTPRTSNNNKLGYDGYIKSYEMIKDELIKLLKYKNISVKFYNKDSYFKELEWKK